MPLRFENGATPKAKDIFELDEDIADFDNPHNNSTQSNDNNTQPIRLASLASDVDMTLSQSLKKIDEYRPSWKAVEYWYSEIEKIRKDRGQRGVNEAILGESLDSNTCALRMSYALYNAKVSMQLVPTLKSQKILTGNIKNDKYIMGASGMAKFLKTI